MQCAKLNRAVVLHLGERGEDVEIVAGADGGARLDG